MNLTKYEIYHENKCHTSPDFPYNTYLCSIPLDFRAVHTHWHEEVEIIVIKKGTGIVAVDLTEYTVHQGDIVFVMSGQLHAIRQFQDSAMEYENILFKPALLRSTGYDLCWEMYLSPMFSATMATPAIIRDHTATHDTMLHYIDQIDQCCDEKDIGYQMAVKGWLYLLLRQLFSCSETAATRPPKKQLEKVKVALSYIERHYSEPITIADMAGLCYYSKSHFMRFFKENIGVSFITYLNDFRLEMAANMLGSAEDNVLDIAIACGFDNLSYFNRSFKRKFDMTPKQYRKRAAGISALVEEPK